MAKSRPRSTIASRLRQIWADCTLFRHDCGPRGERDTNLKGTPIKSAPEQTLEMAAAVPRGIIVPLRQGGMSK